MRLPARVLGALALLAPLPAALGVAPATAQIAYAPCGDSNQYACGHLTVPIDPAAPTAGGLTLALRRHRAPLGEARSAIIALAGGPGQPALPLTEQFAELLGTAASTRDLIVFDQRGVGLSHPLTCRAFEHPGAYHSLAAAVSACAAQLGPARMLFTTAQSVADIEALREAGGYEKLVLYGTSYGTKVAEDYARAHPDRVEALVLDSVVTPDGPDPLARSSFAAVPRVLSALCAARACAGLTRDPVADLATLTARIHARGVRGTALDGRGRRHPVPVSADQLFAVLLVGDFSPMLRAQFVTAVRSARLRDTAPLARLLLTLGGAGEREASDPALYYATSCEEQQFPWNRAAPAGKRLHEVIAALRALPPSIFAPFTAATSFDLGNAPACAAWPLTPTAAPAPSGAPLPHVPALILSGAADLRTPTGDARALAELLPGANLLVVPNTGHSVLGSDPSSCASDALQALFAAHPVMPCRVTRAPAALRPPPLPPTRLGQVPAAHGYAGAPGRTLHAVTMSLGDLARQLLLEIGAGAIELSGGNFQVRIGGLRAGWARFSGGQLLLRGYSFVPGVTVSGSVESGSGTLAVGGATAAHGVLRVSAQGAVSGTLGGRRVHGSAISGAAAGIVGSNARSSSLFGVHDAAGRRVAAQLGRLLGGFLES